MTNSYLSQLTLEPQEGHFGLNLTFLKHKNFFNIKRN